VYHVTPAEVIMRRKAEFDPRRSVKRAALEEITGYINDGSFKVTSTNGKNNTEAF
jgi:hypothetical protein